MHPADLRGVVYVATGARYLAEAAAARAQLRRSNPSLPAALITDLPPPAGDWQAIILAEAPSHSLRDKIQMHRAPWRHTIFLDTDTHVAANLDLLFRLLEDGFEVIGHQLFEGHNYVLPEVPDSFPEFNTGVIGFTNTPRVQAFFDQWRTAYDRFAPGVACDQQSFRVALYRSGLRHSVLTPEYNFRPLATNFAITDLRILHGRPLENMPALKARIDVNLVHRAYVPRLRCVVSDNMTLAQYRRLWLAVTGELFKTATRPLRHWLRRR